MTSSLIIRDTDESQCIDGEREAKLEYSIRSLNEPHARRGGRIITARGVKDTRIIQPTESTKQGSWGFTETEEAILEHCSVLRSSACYGF